MTINPLPTTRFSDLDDAYARATVARGDGTTDDHATLTADIASFPTTPDAGRGGLLMLRPGRVYGISETLEITQPMVAIDGGVGGGINTRGATTIKALTGFTGPLIKINVAAGDKGVWLRNLRLDGNNEAGLTALIEYADGTISDAHLDNVAGVNAPIGIKTGSNCQSLIWDRVRMLIGIGTALDMGADNRAITIRDSRLGGTTRAALIGVDTAETADTCQQIRFEDCELYAKGASPSDVVLVRNAEAVTFTGSYIERDNTGDTIESLLVLGTATAQASGVVTLGCRFQGNAKATYPITIANANQPAILPNLYKSFGTLAVHNTDTDSRGIVLGIECDAYTGLILSLGENQLADPQFHNNIAVIRAAGQDCFAAWVEGDANPRYALRNNGGLRGGSGSAGADATLTRATGGHWLANNKLLATGGIGVGNSAAATTLGTVTGKMEVFDASGVSLGYLPIYDGIT